MLGPFWFARNARRIARRTKHYPAPRADRPGWITDADRDYFVIAFLVAPVIGMLIVRLVFAIAH